MTDEPPRDPDKPTQNLDWFKRIFGTHLPLESETTTFILVSLLDYFMTFMLLQYGGGPGHRFNESNPVARYFIESWGMKKGMLGFKLTVVTFVCLVAQAIASKRVDLGSKVLNFGSLATGGVVIYSAIILWRSWQ